MLGSSRRWLMSQMMSNTYSTAIDATVIKYGKYHGIGNSSCCWIWTKSAKTPMMSVDAKSITNIQMFNCKAGQWYLCTASERRSNTSEPLVVVVVVVVVVEAMVRWCCR